MESLRREKELDEESKRKAQLERFKKDAEERALKEQAEKERREKEKEAKKERERLEREEFEKRERDREEKKRKELEEKKLKEEKDRKDREDRDKKLREEREQREKEENLKRQKEKEELEDRMKKDREEKERLKKQREQEEKDLREKLTKDREEKEKADREKREKEKQEREERDRLEKEKREKELKDRKEKEEKDKREREEKEKRDREEREKKEKEDRENKLEEDRLRREREQKERDLKNQREKEEREKLEKQRKEEDDKRRREKEEEDRKKREAAEDDRKKREKEDEDRKLREKQEADKREKERLEREEKERNDRLEKQKRDEEERLKKLENEKKEREEREKREKEEADRKEKERLAELQKKREEEDLKRKKEQEEAAKKAAQHEDDGFDDFEDDFGDMDDILGSLDNNKPGVKTPEPPKAPETKPAAVVPETKVDAKKKPPADEEIEFDDFDDDGFDDLIEGSIASMKKQPAAKPDPVKPAVKAEPEKPAPKTPASQPPTKPGAVVQVDNILKHKKVFTATAEHLALEDQYIHSVMPMSEEEVQLFLGEIQASGQLLNMLFNEFISSKLMFMLDLEETDTFLQICLAWTQTGKLDQKNIDATAAAIQDTLNQIFEGDFKDIKYFFAPLDVIEEFQEESICHAILDVKNQQVLLVSLNPSITEADIRKNPFAQKLCSVFSRVVSSALETDAGKDVQPDNIHLVELKPDLREFLTESCEDPSLRFAMITYLILFENATDTHDFDGFKESLGFENYTREHASRFVSTIKNLGQSLSIRTGLSQQPELLQGLMAVVQMNMAKFNIQVIVSTAEEVTPASELQEKIQKDFEEIVDVKSSASKVFAVLEYCPTETQKLMYFILLQDDEPSILLYLDTNCEPHNLKCLSILESSFKGSSLPYNVYFEHTRHQFMQNNVDVFIYTWLIQVCEAGLPGIEALRLLIYNELPFVIEIMQADMDGEEEEGGLGLEDGQEEMMVGDDEFDEDFDNILGDQKGAAGKATVPQKPTQKPSQKPAVEKFEDGDDFDDMDSGELGFAPKGKKTEPKKSDKNLKPTGTQSKKDNNFDYGDEFEDEFDNDIGKEDGGFDDDDFDF